MKALMTWSPQHQGYLDHRTGTAVPLERQSWPFFAVQMAGGFSKVLATLRVTPDQLRAWLTVGAVDDRDLARALSKLSGVPQYLLRGEQGERS